MVYRPDRGVRVLTRNLAGLQARIAAIRAQNGGVLPANLWYLELWEANLLQGIQRRSVLNAVEGPPAPPSGVIPGPYDDAVGGYPDLAEPTTDMGMPDFTPPSSGNGLGMVLLLGLGAWALSRR